MADNTLLTAHIVVDFEGGSASDIGLVVEVDDREDGYNAGRTSFFPGQDAYLLAFVPTGYYIDATYISAGVLSLVGSDTKEVEDFVEFPNTDDASLSYPATSGFTYSWLGSNLGLVTLASQKTVTLPARTFNTVTKKFVPEYRVGVAKLNYNAACSVYKVSGVPTTVSRVLAFFVAKKL